MKPVNLAIIGTGLAANELHLPVLENMKDRFNIVAVCNHTEAKAKIFAEKVGGVPYFLHHTDLLKMDEVEAVDICLPIHLNYQAALDCLNAGKHVFLEKPIAHDIEHGKKMLEFPKRFPDRVMMVAENFRYNERLVRIKSLIEEGKIGTPYAIAWNVYFDRDVDNKWAQTAWRIHHKYPGGFVLDDGIHKIAGIRHMLGDFDTAATITAQINPDIGEMDTAAVQFQLQSGVHGTLHLQYTAIGMEEDSIYIFGDKGAIHSPGERIILKQKDMPDAVVEFEPDPGYRGEFIDFYEALRKGNKPCSTFEKAFRDLEVMINILNAAKSGRRERV